MAPSPHSDPVDHALATRRWETARRLCAADLANPSLPQEQINRRLRQLHQAYQLLGDFPAASSALSRIIPATPEETCELALTLATDFGNLTQYGFYRNSTEAKAGLTYEVYVDKMRAQARKQIDYVLGDGGSLEQKNRAQILLDILYLTHEGLTFERALREKTQPEPAPAPVKVITTGSVAGTVRFANGEPATGVTITLGLRFDRPFPDPATHLDRTMGGVPEIGPIRGLTAITDDQGAYRFDDVPADDHEFLAVTLDPTAYDIPTRFLQQGVKVESRQTTQANLQIDEWKSAPPRPVESPFPLQIQHEGRAYRRVHELTLKNPFLYDFPRQPVSLSLPPEVSLNPAALLLFSSVEERKLQPFQIGRDGFTFFTNLPQQSDRIFAVYQVEGAIPSYTPQPGLELVPDASGLTAVIDTGAAAFRIAFGEGTDVIPPLVSVRSKDGAWRGHGRFLLPENITLVSRQTKVLETGPLVLSVRIDYALSNQATYSWILTAHRDEAYLLVREISPELEGAAFDFSLREFSGGRGYLHWCFEGDSQHWTDLTSDDRELARIQESVAWWLPPQGFGYGMSHRDLSQHDFVAVFSRRRGEWIDRLFAQVSQGPGENRELDWPFPEMVGSTVSMITAHTDKSGDAYFHFGFFDGERQWGILVSEVERNDGLFKEISAVQHKNSSPRLQDFKDWTLDEQDKMNRPFVMAHREDLRKIRAKKAAPTFAPYWDRITSGRSRGGPGAAVLFAVENNPLAAWRKKVELVYAAQIRPKMILLGRDFGDCYSPVGARPVAPWAESYDLIVASGCFTAEEERLVRQFFVLMGHMHMEPDLMNWKFNSRNANFESDRTDLVGTVGLCFLGHTDARKFIDHCISLTERSLNIYCTPGSGRWYENPACYYLHASKCRMNLLFHLHRHGLFDATTIPRLKDFLRWGVLLLTPRCPSSYEQMRDGVPGDRYLEQDRVRRLPPVGDHAHIGPWVPDHYATAAQMYRQSDPAFSDLLLAAFNEGGNDGGAYGNAPLIFCALDEDDLRPVQLPAAGSRRLEGFGALFREHMGTDREFYLLLKQGPGGYRYHRTEGSIILFVDSRPLIYEGGEAGDTWRHSTLSFYDAEMPLAVGHVERFHALPGLGFVQGVHPLALPPGAPSYLNDSCSHTLVPEAYARFAEPNPVDVRSLLTVQDEYIIMHDDLRLAPEIPCRWHLQVVSNSHTGDAAQGYLFAGRFGVDLQVLFPGQTFTAETVEQLPIHDYQAAPVQPHDGAEGYFFAERHRNAVRPPAECFATRHLMVQAANPKHYLAILRPLNGDRKPLSATELSQNDRAIGVAVKGENIDDLIFLGREAFTWESKGIRFQGRYGAILRRADKLQLYLLAGASLAADGFCISSEGPTVQLDIRSGNIELTIEGTGRVEIQGLSHPARFVLSGERMQVNLGRGPA